MSGPMETTIGKCELQILLDRRVQLDRRGHKVGKQLLQERDVLPTIMLVLNASA
jgi:hypothetical protein